MGVFPYFKPSWIGKTPRAKVAKKVAKNVALPHNSINKLEKVVSADGRANAETRLN